jgi:hypothetical protein
MSTLCNLTTAISGNQCIGDTLPVINANFNNLDVAVCNLSTHPFTLQVIDSPTINLTLSQTANVAKLSADYIGGDISNLYSLVRKLTSDMQNIGNYPYLEYGWVTALNAAPQNIRNTVTTLSCTTKIVDTQGIGYDPVNSTITVDPGTYSYEAGAETGSLHNYDAKLLLYNGSTLIGNQDGTVAGSTFNSGTCSMKGVVTFNTQASLTLRMVGQDFADPAGYVFIKSGDQYGNQINNSTTTLDKRVWIKLWKVG